LILDAGIGPGLLGPLNLILQGFQQRVGGFLALVGVAIIVLWHGTLPSALLGAIIKSANRPQLKDVVKLVKCGTLDHQSQLYRRGWGKGDGPAAQIRDPYL
jgi:hypothetical protein